MSSEITVLLTTEESMGEPNRKRKDDVVLLGELSRASGVPRSTLYIQARSGELPGVFRGGRYEFQRRDLPALVARLRAARKTA
jgi:hypothetical protein